MSERMEFQFVGTTSTPLSLDPAEFAGMSVQRITAEILKTLADISPGVNFFHDDVVLAAEALIGVDNSANGNEERGEWVHPALRDGT